MRRVMTAAMALALVSPCAGCSYLNFESTSQAATTGGDDVQCQAAGYVYGTPDYTQCRQTLERDRPNAERAEAPRPYYVPQR
jgi:hypothetical protein